MSILRTRGDIKRSNWKRKREHIIIHNNNILYWYYNLYSTASVRPIENQNYIRSEWNPYSSSDLYIICEYIVHKTVNIRSLVNYTSTSRKYVL